MTKSAGHHRHIAIVLDKVCKPFIKKMGQIRYNLWKNWPKIIGEDYQDKCELGRLSYQTRYDKQEAVLYIIAFDSSTAFKLAHMEGVLLERITLYFGYKAIDKIKITQKPLLQKPLEEKGFN